MGNFFAKIFRIEKYQKKKRTTNLKIQNRQSSSESSIEAFSLKDERQKKNENRKQFTAGKESSQPTRNNSQNVGTLEKTEGTSIDEGTIILENQKSLDWSNKDSAKTITEEDKNDKSKEVQEVHVQNVNKQHFVEGKHTGNNNQNDSKINVGAATEKTENNSTDDKSITSEDKNSAGVTNKNPSKPILEEDAGPEPEENASPTPKKNTDIGAKENTGLEPKENTDPELKENTDPELKETTEALDPTSVITEDCVTKALKTDFGPVAELASFEIIDFTNPGDNYSCKVTSVNCKCVIGEKSFDVSYVAKVIKPWGFEASTRFMNDIFVRESKFLTKLKAKLNFTLICLNEPKLRLPECVYSNIEKDQSIIIMKDLRKDKFKLFDRRIGMDVPHATLVLKELGRLHASGFILKKRLMEQSKQKLIDRYPFLLDIWVKEKNPELLQFFEKMLEGATRMLKDNPKNEKVVKCLKKMEGKAVDIFVGQLASSAPQFETICHGDCWNNNSMFRYSEDNSPEDVVLVDLQMCRVASLATDLNYFFMTSTEGHMRNNNLDVLLTAYYDQLKWVMEKASLKVPFTFEELKKEYFNRNIYGFFSAQMLLPLVMRESSETIDFTLMTEENKDQFLEDLAIKNEKLMMANPMFNSRWLSVIDDCLQSGALEEDWEANILDVNSKKTNECSSLHGQNNRPPRSIKSINNVKKKSLCEEKKIDTLTDDECEINPNVKPITDDANEEKSEIIHTESTESDCKDTKEAPDPNLLITESVVAKALNKDLGSTARLESFEVIDFTKPGDNYSCKVTSVYCKYMVNEKSFDNSYVVKLSQQFGFDGAKDMMNEVFIKESKFLTEISESLNNILIRMNECKIRLPVCVYEHIEPNKSILFMKDLRMEQFKMFDRTLGMDVPHATLVIKELGRLHACGFILKKLVEDKNEKLIEKYPCLKEIWGDHLNTEMVKFLENLLESPIRMLRKKGNYAGAVRSIEEMQGRAPDIFVGQLTNSSSQFETICHGDAWNNNFVFRYSKENSPEEVVLLDLQMCRLASIATDLTYFLMSSTEGEMRKKNLDILLKIYHEQVSSIMEKASLKVPFTFEELKKEYSCRHIYGFFSTQILLPIVMQESSQAVDFTQISGDNVDEFMDDLTIKNEKMMMDNPMFSSRWLAVVDECIESGALGDKGVKSLGVNSTKSDESSKLNGHNNCPPTPTKSINNIKGKYVFEEDKVDTLTDDANKDNSKILDKQNTESHSINRNEAPDPNLLITESIVTKALKMDFGSTAKLVSFEVIDFTKPGDNYISKVTSVYCNYMINGNIFNSTYVVKLLKQFGFDSAKDMVNELFIKESNFLMEISENMNNILISMSESKIRLPVCVYAHIDPNKSVLFLKDLRKEQFKMFDKTVGLDVPHATLVIKELGRLHGCGFILKKLVEEKNEKILEKYQCLKEIWVDHLDTEMNKYFENMLEFPIRMLNENANYAAAVRSIEEMQGRAQDIFVEQLTNSSTQFETICHGDAWNNNFLFRYSKENSPEDVVLLDLQMCRLSSIATDLNFFLMTSTEGEMRKKNLNMLLKIYHEQLSSIMEKATLKAPFTFEELTEEYSSRHIYGFFAAQFVLPGVMRESSQAVDLTQISGDNIDDLMNDRTIKNEKIMMENPMFSSRWLAVIDECMESGALGNKGSKLNNIV